MPYKDKEKQKKAQRLWSRDRNKRHREIVVNKLGGCCIDCNNLDIRVLQIDHKQPLLRKPGAHNTSGTNLINKIFYGKIDINTVCLRCANCHMIKTFEDRLQFKNWVND